MQRFSLYGVHKRDYQESVTTGQTDARTHRQTPDKVIPMCCYASQATQKSGEISTAIIFVIKVPSNENVSLYLKFVVNVVTQKKALIGDVRAGTCRSMTITSKLSASNISTLRHTMLSHILATER